MAVSAVSVFLMRGDFIYMLAILKEVQCELANSKILPKFGPAVYAVLHSPTDRSFLQRTLGCNGVRAAVLIAHLVWAFVITAINNAFKTTFHG
jgi:hypothetical protein